MLSLGSFKTGAILLVRTLMEIALFIVAESVLD